MAAVSQTELLSQVRMFVNTARRGRFGHTFSVTASPGLSEVYDRTYSVPTGIATELDELLGRLDGASIGVAGPRGCGKSTLIRRYCDDGGRVQTRPEKFSWNMLLSPDLPNNSRGDLRCLVAAPVDYVPRDFVLHMFAVFCRAVIGRYGRKPGVTDRLARGLYWLRRKGWLVVSLLLRTFFYAGPGVVLLYWTHAIAKQISVPSSRVRYAAIGVISVGILSFAWSSVKTVRLWGRVAGPGGNKALAVTARRHLARVRYLQTHTSGWSGALRLPGGSQAQRSGSTSRAEQPLSYPEIVDEFRAFAREVAADVHRNGDRVFISIDELDKIGSAEQAEHFLNEIKGIFGIPHLYFVVSVSDDALTAFDRRGLPLRDAFDSSFDEIIHVGPLGYEESRRLLYRRVIGLTEPYVALCYCLAGGLARDLIRAARHVVRTAAGLTANKSSSLALDTGVFGLEVTGGAVNSAFRMLEAQALKNALNGSAGVLALAASPWFFEEVIRHTPASAPESYRQTRISVKETRDTAWICLPDDPYPRATAAALPAPSAERPAPPMAAVPRQLPVVTWGFAGRVAELAELTSALEEAAEDGGTVVISAIEGTAGIGKTTLAVYWAHQVADRFPDGQLYVNLRGFDPAGSPMAPAEAVRGFLDALGVPPERIPVSLHAQTALYRSLLAGRRVLVVLDNALDAAQVRPLLPGSAACMAVVTSRNRLTSLVAAEGARLLTVDLLTPAEARQLLAGRLGAGRVAADSLAIEEIITSCARLPLALSIVAARASAHLSFPMAALARELDEARGGLEAFDGGEQAAQVRAVFSWSYPQLSLEAAGLFRRLGLQLGHDVTVPAAASLAGVTVASVRSAMAELARSHLVNEHTPGRYTFHDLLRAYAAELAHTHDPEPERRKTLHRVLDHYVHTAYAAAILVY